jgi:hypothetical protein
MNVYPSKFNDNKTCVCIVNDIDHYTVDRQYAINRADYTISNLTGMGYTVFEHKSIDKLLQRACAKYDHAVVISAGTEFINGTQFFDTHPKEYDLLCHILDGGDAYYGIHPQCFSIDLQTYIDLDCPEFGEEQFFTDYKALEPLRSHGSIHDDYLPTWIGAGKIEVNYKHKQAGWNLIKTLLDNHHTIEAYAEDQRNGKFYQYRGGETSSYIYQKYNYCLTTHVHTQATGKPHYPRVYDTPIMRLVAPANPAAAEQRGPAAEYIYYDYNLSALEAAGGGIHVDPVNTPDDFVAHIPKDDPQRTVIDMSNVFCYEGTAAMYSLRYRVAQENKLILALQQELGDATVIFDQRAAEGIQTWIAETGLVKDLTLTDYNSLDLPSWH